MVTKVKQNNEVIQNLAKSDTVHWGPPPPTRRQETPPYKPEKRPPHFTNDFLIVIY